MKNEDIVTPQFKFLAELKRRNVFRVAAMYLGSAWLIVQLGAVLAETFQPLHRAMPAVIGVLAAALPLILVGAWFFERTADGFKLTRRVERSRSIRELTARKLDRLIMIVLVLAVLALLADRWMLHRPTDESMLVLLALMAVVLFVDRLIPRAAGTSAASLPVASKTETTPAAPPSMAVLPFANLTGEPEKEYFGDGMAEELINVLSKVPGLKVPARTSSFAYKGKNVDVRQIARDLGVATVLEGSVRSAGERIRVVAQLVNASTGFHVWSHSWDRQFEDLFKVQDELAGAIVRALGLSGNGSSIGSLAQAPPTNDLEAYQLYLQGLSLSSRVSEQNLLRAIELFEQAHARDPNFTRAKAAAISARSGLTGWGITAFQTLAAAEREARQALALDPGLAVAHALLGHLNARRGRWLEAEKHFRAALSDESADPFLRSRYASQVLSPVGHMRQALHEVGEAYRLAPAEPRVVASLAMAHLILANDAEALRYARLAVDLGFERLVVLVIHSHAALRAKRYDEAAEQMFAALPVALRNQLDPVVLKIAYSALGDASHKPAALAALGRLDVTTGDATIDLILQVQVILLYTLLGVLDRAFEQANRFLDRFAESGEIGNPGAWGTLWFPEMRPFREDSRFVAFAMRLGWMDYWKQYGPPDDCELRNGKLICR